MAEKACSILIDLRKEALSDPSLRGCFQGSYGANRSLALQVRLHIMQGAVGEIRPLRALVFLCTTLTSHEVVVSQSVILLRMELCCSRWMLIFHSG